MLTVTAAESADDAGGLDPLTACVVTGLPTWVPLGAGHVPPLVWVGSQTKKVTVPVGVPSPELAACTTAWSVTWDPKVTVPPWPGDGVVVVVVAIVWTVKHSLVPLAPPFSLRAAG